jgi:hypothetical protein
MDKFNNPYAKLFYAVYKLHRQGSISNEDKFKLKEMIIADDQSVIDLINSYLKDLDAESLMEGMIKIVRPIRHKPEPVLVSKTMNDDISSPLGTFLHEKKKRQNAEHDLKLSLQNSEITSIVETHEEH